MPFFRYLHRGVLLPLFIPFIVLAALTRIVLIGYALKHKQLEASAFLIGKIFAFGILSDFITFAYFAAPIFLLLLLVPRFLKRTLPFRLFGYLLYFCLTFALFFTLASEYIFWEEFGSRFNFIAVDYLVYTQEVVGNIRESYPVFTIISALLALSVLFFLAVGLPMLRRMREEEFPILREIFQTLTFGLAVLILFLLPSFSLSPAKDNHYAEELAGNGIYTLFQAFRMNSLSYAKFYLTGKDTESFTRLRKIIKADNENFISDDPLDIRRRVVGGDEPKRYNVMLISVESLSAEFLGMYGPDQNLTPFLNSLSKEGLIFTNYYATGTRTVRGLEAMTLSIPPTPGTSLVRAPGNENLFSIGSVFREHGYDTRFIYGGYGYFDNMNYFYSHNGFTVLDRSSMPKEEVSFANAWGVADEDLFKQAIKAADSSYASKKPFFSLVMTTSNHRPYTYPDGKIDIPSGKGRKGAVKYTDYAIKQLLEIARTKPWFDNTIFVITADHCASSAGKLDIPVEKYHIPLIIYAPSLVKPQAVDTLASQIDLAPTIFGLMDFTYTSQFYGNDIFHLPKGRAVLGTYQKLGLYTGDHLLILGPKRMASSYRMGADGDAAAETPPENLLHDAISYYQTAAYRFTKGLMQYKETLPETQK